MAVITAGEPTHADVGAAHVHHHDLVQQFFEHRIPFIMPNASLSAAERFYHEAVTRLEQILSGQRAALDRAATLCTEAIARDGLVHLFGCGHSRMLCEEMTPRQGCFVGWHTIVELA